MEINNTTKYKKYNNSIQDIDMGLDVNNTDSIMTLLRNSIYSNPLESFVREIYSNAVDAHLKAGIDKEIKVSLEFSSDEDLYYFVVRDFGASMTVEDFKNVYAKMGSSTKTSSNTEMGGFGLGAKSPLAYTNQFFIDTYTTEDDKNIHRSWVQYIDSTQVGKISLLEEGTFTGDTGTQIRIPVQLKDYSNIIQCINTYLSYSIIPFETEGFEFEDVRPSLEILGDDWGIDLDYSRYYYSSNPYEPATIVVAGIPYRINKRALETKFSTTSYKNVIQHLLKGKDIKSDYNLFYNFLNASRHFKYVLMAPIGSVDLSASREDLQYTERTCCYLFMHMFKMFQGYCTHLNIDYVKNPSYLDACYKFTTKSSEVIKCNLLNNIYWEKESLAFTERPFLFSSGYGTYLKRYCIEEQGSTWNNTDKKVLKSTCINRININDKTNNSIFVLQDTEYVNYTRFLKDYLLRIVGEEFSIYVVTKEEITSLCSWVLESTDIVKLSDIVSEYKEYNKNNASSTRKKRDTSVFSAYVYKGSDYRSKADRYARFFDKDKAPTKPEEVNYYVSNEEMEELYSEGIRLPYLGYWSEFPSTLNKYLDSKGILKEQVWFTPKPSKYFSHENWHSLANLIKEDFKKINIKRLKEHSDIVYISKKIPSMAPFFLSLEQGSLSDDCRFAKLKKQYFYYKKLAQQEPSFNEIACLCIPAYKDLVTCQDTHMSSHKEEALIESELISEETGLIRFYKEFIEDYPLLNLIGYCESYEGSKSETNFRDYIYARSVVLKDDNKKITSELKFKSDSEYKIMMDYFS